MKKIIIIVLFINCSFLWGEFSPSESWKIIKSEYFDILFDERLEADAVSIANKLDSSYEVLSKTMGHSIERYTIILPSEMIDSNGYVEGLRPLSVFYPVPPTSAFAGTLDWYDLLSTHETRHMVQFSDIRDSFLQKVLQFTFGGNAAAAYAFIPSYFYEGDAVLTETLLSDSGRGRTPSFERSLRTILLSDKEYSFSKALHRSNRDFYPNHYVLGYYMITYMRREYGADVVEKILSAAANNPLPMNFSAASIFVIGKSMPEIYKDAMADLKVKWEDQDSFVVPTEIAAISVEESKTFKNDYYPKINGNGTLFYMEQGLNVVNSLVEQRDNGEIIKHIPISGGYSLFDNFIAFSEMSSDIRWEKRGYSDIYIYNTDTKDKVRLTSNQRYFKPVFSTNGERLAVIQFDYNRVPSVVVLNSFSGEILQTIPFDRGYSILDLSWNDDDSFIALSIISKKGNQLGVIDLESEKYSSVTSWDNIQRSKVQYYGNKLIFTSSYSGIDGIYSIDLDTLKEYRVVSSRFGADYPFIYNDELIFSDYTIDGFKLNKISLDSSCFIPLAQVVKGHVDYFSPLLTEEETIPTIDNPVKYVSSNYNPNLHLININSWLINPITPVMVGSEVFNSSIDKLFFKVPEIVLFSSDYLGLMDNTFYTHYNIDRELWDFGSIGTYRGLFPIIGWDLNIFSEGLDSSIDILNVSANFNIPLSLASGSASSGIKIGVAPHFYRDFRLDNSIYTELSYYLNYWASKSGNQRRIKSYDFLFDSTLRFTNGYGYERPALLGADVTMILPGLSKSSNVELSIGGRFDFKDLGSLFLSNEVLPICLALENVRDNSSLIGFGKAEYGVSFLYPDLSLLNWSFWDSFNGYLGYEGVFKEGVDPLNIIYSKLELTYYLLRIVMPFESSFTYFYNISSNRFDYIVNPISIKVEL